MHTALPLLGTIDSASVGPDLAWTLAALAVGLMLWAAGGNILRPAVGALGLTVGAIAGWMVWQETGIGPAWAMPLAGALVTACVALLAWHLASGVLLSVLGGLLAGSVAWTAVFLMAPDEIAAPPVADVFGIEHQLLDQANSMEPAVFTPAEASGGSLAEDLVRKRSQSLADQVAARSELAPVRAAWSTVPAQERMIILISAAAAALCGLLLAALAQSTAAVLLTAIGGSLMIAGAVPRLAHTLGATDLGLSAPRAAVVAVIVWFVLALLGCAIQCATGQRTPAAPAEA